ncbi:MAG TPA: aminotransferase class V-fold PLP-dependent enzyme, partial [Polyangiales bacterium]|nr:aminotransferase class V-fold PLP-dependent enzyme [Polyangiales bacterium]
AVLDTCKRLERTGIKVTYLDPQKDGRVSAEQVKAALTDKTILVTLMLANNEIGSIHPIAEIGKVTREAGVLLHCDGVQGAGKVELDVEAMNIDLCSISAHKMYGPKGVGALYVRRSKPRVRIVGELDGGGHERGMRSGTLNVPGIVGFGKAAELANQEWRDDAKRIFDLRQRLREHLFSELEEVYLNGADDPWRVPGNLNVSFAFVEGEALLMAIKDVAVSSGSACTSASLEPSYVLRALGVDGELAHSSIRFGIGKFNTVDEIDYVGELVVAQTKRLREMSPLYEMHKEGIDLSTIQWEAH